MQHQSDHVATANKVAPQHQNPGGDNLFFVNMGHPLLGEGVNIEFDIKGHRRKGGW